MLRNQRGDARDITHEKEKINQSHYSKICSTVDGLTRGQINFLRSFIQSKPICMVSTLKCSGREQVVHFLLVRMQSSTASQQH